MNVRFLAHFLACKKCFINGHYSLSIFLWLFGVCCSCPCLGEASVSVSGPLLLWPLASASSSPPALLLCHRHVTDSLCSRSDHENYVIIVCVCSVASVMSDSLWPHGLQPARLFCPWGFSRQATFSICAHPGLICNLDSFSFTLFMSCGFCFLHITILTDFQVFYSIFTVEVLLWPLLPPPLFLPSLFLSLSPSHPSSLLPFLPSFFLFSYISELLLLSGPVLDAGGYNGE